MYVYYCRTWYKTVCHANAVCTVAAFDMIEVVGGSRAGWGTVTRRAVVYGEIERSKVGLKLPLTYTPACDCACLKCSMRRQEHTSGVRVYVRVCMRVRLCWGALSALLCG